MTAKVAANIESALGKVENAEARYGCRMHWEAARAHSRRVQGYDELNDSDKKAVKSHFSELQACTLQSIQMRTP